MHGLRRGRLTLGMGAAVITVAAAVVATAPGSAARPAPSHFSGSVSVFGRNPTAAAGVRAYIGATECGVGAIKGTYALNALAAQDKPGCGTEGAEVKFAVGDYWANETAPWAAGAFQDLDLSAPRLQSLTLAPGCNEDIKSTFSNKTAIADLVQMIQPAENLQAVWKRAGKEWQSFFPDGRDVDNTLKTIDRGELITVCVGDSAALSLPIPAPTPASSATPASR